MHASLKLNFIDHWSVSQQKDQMFRVVKTSIKPSFASFKSDNKSNAEAVYLIVSFYLLIGEFVNNVKSYNQNEELTIHH